MSIRRNVTKIIEARKRKGALQKIGKDAVRQGVVEGKFLEEYNVFSTELRKVLENTLIDKEQKYITIAPKEAEHASYFNYLAKEDDNFKNFYNIHANEDGSYGFEVKDDFKELLNDDFYSDNEEPTRKSFFN